MRKRVRILLTLLGVFLGIVFVPVLVRQLGRAESAPRPPIRLDSLRYEEIRFENPAAGIVLAGMLFVPAREPPFPAVVMIHGSGTSSRGNSWYLTYAAYLQRNGIAVLLPDKRGSGASAGDWRSSSLEDLATDTEAAISHLREERPRRASSIGVLGISQGGMIAPIVAARSAELAFAINVVGGAIPMHDLLLYEEQHNLAQMGFLPGVSHGLAHATSAVNRMIVSRDFWSAVGDFDPLNYWRKVDIPALVLFGDQDTNVPSGRSRDRLIALGKDNVRVVVFQGSGHGLEPPSGIGGDRVREDALELIRAFVLANSRNSLFGIPAEGNGIIRDVDR